MLVSMKKEAWCNAISPEVNDALCPAERGQLNFQFTYMNHGGCSVQGSSLCMNKCLHLFHLGFH